MPYNDLRNEYKKTQVNTANQGKLIVMLYEGAIKFINNAIDAMPKKEIEKIHNNIVKAQDILTELTTSLNMDAGEISQKLFSIYMYLSQRLTDANIKKSKEPLIEVKKHLSVLKDAWVEAGKKVQVNKSEIEKGGVNIAT
ncbi:MAG: flagellar export chaperone FliS [Spirochaetes bacterium]|nr:flagellar export chaperone FliS [Spirochaetota bacterium]